MAYQARVTTFSDGNYLPGSALEGEFDPIYDLLAGTANKNVKLSYSASDIANLILDNTGSGVLFQAMVSGVSKLEIDAAGTLDSKVVTGTAPITVDSTTMCPNLNADLLDGNEASAFVTVAGDYLVDSANVRIDGATGANPQVFEIKAPASEAVELHFLPFTEANQRFRIRHDSVNMFVNFDADNGSGTGWSNAEVKMDLVTANIYLGTSGIVQVLNTRDHTTPFVHREQFVKSWSALTVSERFIYDDAYPVITCVTVRYVYQSGTVAGNSTLHVKKYNAAGVEQLSRTVTLSSGDTAGQVYEVNITDFDLDTDGDQLSIIGVTNNGHTDISVQVNGTHAFEVV